MLSLFFLNRSISNMHHSSNSVFEFEKRFATRACIQSYGSFSTIVITPQFQTRHLVVDLGVRLLHYEVR